MFGLCNFRCWLLVVLCCKLNMVLLIVFCWLSLMVWCIIMINGICFVWLMNIIIMRLEISVWFLNGVDGGFCCWFVMICVFWYGCVIRMIMIWCCMLLIGWCCVCCIGSCCWLFVWLKIRFMLLVVIGLVLMVMVIIIVVIVGLLIFRGRLLLLLICIRLFVLMLSCCWVFFRNIVKNFLSGVMLIFLWLVNYFLGVVVFFFYFIMICIV